VAKYVLKMSDVLEITVEGHADAVGSDEYNLRLSKLRAESVRDLLNRYGLGRDRVKAEAFGRSKLRVQSNHSERINRRVEFWITRTASGVTPAPKPATTPPTTSPIATPPATGATP
jgi:OmpA-OmpF porin, OOP family